MGDLISNALQHHLLYKQRRLSESRLSGTNPISIPRPLQHHRNGIDPSYARGRSESSSPSTYPSLGRSLDELRLHNHPSHPEARGITAANDSREKDRRLISDADIDPALQNGSSQRIHSSAESPQSLPSLKASGLLDSWNTPKENLTAVGTWSTPSHSRLDSQRPIPLHRHSPSRMTTPLPHSTNDPDSSRSTTLGMPVGLQWLANESR